MKLNKFLNPGSVIMLILAIWMLHRNIQLTQEQSLLNNHNLTLLQDSTAFSKRLTEKGDTIAIQEEMILSERQAQKVLKEELEYLKEVKNNVRVITKTEIKEVEIPVASDPIFIERDLDKFLKLPQSYKDSTELFSFSATVNETGLKINSLKIENRSSISIGLQKRGFFRRAEPVVTVHHSNPLIQTQGMQNVTVDLPKPFYETRTFNIGLGIAAGLLISRR